MTDGDDKDLVVVKGEIKTPPVSGEARIEAGYLLRKLQKGELLSLPHSKPMPSIGVHVHELRIPDEKGQLGALFTALIPML